ncbi:hypothetical protein TNCV_553081 [Trichonephila clavipes]|nr:hypothetical protein TNCV_553081 [Trichonephila clavipes]
MTPCGRSSKSLHLLILLYLGTAAVAFPNALLAKDTWQAMVGRHILEDIVGRVAQYVDEHYPVDKWHLGDLGSTIGVKNIVHVSASCQSALKDH